MSRSGDLYHLNISLPRMNLWKEFKDKTSQNLDLTTRIFTSFRFYLDNNCELIISDIPTLRRTLQQLPPEKISLYAKNIKQISMLLKEFE